MSSVFAQQIDGSGNAVYASMGYSGDTAANIVVLDLADSCAIVGANIVTVVFGDETAIIAAFEAADSVDLEAVAQAVCIASVNAAETADSAAIVAAVLTTVSAFIAAAEAADGIDIEALSTAPTSATIVALDAADSSAIAAFVRPIASIAINDAADGCVIGGQGELWIAIIPSTTMWTPVTH